MLLSTAYLPSIAWCSAFWNADKVTLEAWEHYQKGSLRNRAHIAGPNGVQLLSIPLLKGKNQQTPIREVRIANHEQWQRQHWRAIKTAYGNAPYFEHYADGLEAFYEREYEFLFDFNLALMEFVLLGKLGWKGALGVSASFNPTPSPSPFGEGGNDGRFSGILDTLVKEKVDGFGQGGEDSGAYPTPSPSPKGGRGRYGQVFQEKHGFLPNLSILDLLLCCGKRSVEILERTQ